MPEYDLSFSPFSVDEAGSFKLLELPPELNQLIENALKNGAPLSLTIKGSDGEDAVLCTNEKTYALRSVILSNSVLVASPSPDTSMDVGNGVVIRDQVNEIIELVPAVPRLHKLKAILRGQEYDDGPEKGDSNRLQTYTYENAKAEIQASDAELNRGLKERNILVINGQLRPIAASYLNNILELLLNYLVSLSLSLSTASVEELSSTLADEHEIPTAVSTQVMSWFGDIFENKWKVDVNLVSKELGLSILRRHLHEPILKDELLAKWKSLVGDTFESSVSLDLLSGYYLTTVSSVDNSESLKYFSATSLPVEPAARFSDLFLTRSRWKAEDITPFLSDIAVNSKERDRLLLKYCRAITDSQGVWYTARAQYNG